MPFCSSWPCFAMKWFKEVCFMCDKLFSGSSDEKKIPWQCWKMKRIPHHALNRSLEPGWAGWQVWPCARIWMYVYIHIYIYISIIYIIYTYSTRRFKKWGYPQIIHLKWIIHCKPSSYWGNPMESPISVGSVEVTPGLSATASAARSAASSWLAKSMATAISSYHVIF